jgi:ABC-type methionine transport system ATPase subunit
MSWWRIIDRDNKSHNTTASLRGAVQDYFLTSITVRELFKEPTLLLLDEVTSDLDTASEHPKGTCSRCSQRTTSRTALTR